MKSLREEICELWHNDREAYFTKARTLVVTQIAFISPICMWWWEVRDPETDRIALVQGRRIESWPLDLVYGGAA